MKIKCIFIINHNITGAEKGKHGISKEEKVRTQPIDTGGMNWGP